MPAKQKEHLYKTINKYYIAVGFKRVLYIICIIFNPLNV